MQLTILKTDSEGAPDTPAGDTDKQPASSKCRTYVQLSSTTFGQDERESLSSQTALDWGLKVER
jgi:hypothetical protein